MSDVILSVKNLSKSFEGVQALKDVSLTINKGEIRCLLGENGSGKSTLIKIISGVYAPDSGTVEIAGKSHAKLTPIESVHQGVQVIYQDFSIFPNLTVAENISINYQLAENIKVVNWRKIRRVAKATLRRIGVDIDLDAKVETLSVANKQLVAISKALLQDAKLIIMDEPTTALTNKEVDSLFKIIKQLQSEGIAILFVSHKLNEVFEISEKVTIIRNGENVIDGDISDFDISKFVYYMTGREIRSTLFTAEKKAGEAVLQVEKLCLKGGFKDINFKVNKGEILGITGLLGSGRTELALALFGIHKVNSGSIFIDGKQVGIRRIKDAVEHGIGYVPEDRLTEGLFLQQSISRNIIIGIIKTVSSKFGFITNKKIVDQSWDWVKYLGVKTSNPEFPVVTLSGGNQQKVVLAKWLARNPKILILNGPTVGVDIGSKQDIYQTIRGLADRGMAIIIISDDIPEVLNNCNRILIMNRGRIVCETDNQSISEDELAQKLSAEN